MPNVDFDYYNNVREVRSVRGLSAKARLGTYRQFIEEFRPSPNTTILDLGVSDEEGPEANMLEKQYPWPKQITCAGLGDGSVIRVHYPETAFVTIEAGKALPFADRRFDILFSNAVLEHVGGPKERRFFITEAARVSKAFFLIVPNRWFPIEHHTVIPFLHWSPALFRKMLAGSKSAFWSEQKNLDFLSAGMLRREWPLSSTPKFFYSGLYLGPFSSNLVIVSRHG
jgi:hypothetical protein